jgi:NADH:ubiquinone oxidoreductase subunit K
MGLWGLQTRKRILIILISSENLLEVVGKTTFNFEEPELNRHAKTVQRCSLLK